VAEGVGVPVISHRRSASRARAACTHKRRELLLLALGLASASACVPGYTGQRHMDGTLAGWALELGTFHHYLVSIAILQ
jgi:hypothetical protein